MVSTTSKRPVAAQMITRGKPKGYADGGDVTSDTVPIAELQPTPRKPLPPILKQTQAPKPAAAPRATVVPPIAAPFGFGVGSTRRTNFATGGAVRPSGMVAAVRIAMARVRR